MKKAIRRGALVPSFGCQCIHIYMCRKASVEGVVECHGGCFMFVGVSLHLELRLGKT